jgi:hypothetical protein
VDPDGFSTGGVPAPREGGFFSYFCGCPFFVFPAAMEADNFPSERSEQRNEPALHELYRLDREIHENRLRAIHADQERERFVRDAQRARDAQWRRDLLQASKDHGAMALRFAEKADELDRERTEFVEKTLRDTYLPSQACAARGAACRPTSQGQVTARAA